MSRKSLEVGRKPKASTPAPNPLADTETRGLAKPVTAGRAMAEAKCVDAAPPEIEGGYSPKGR